MIFIEILEDICLRIWVDLRNYRDRRRIFVSQIPLNLWQIDGTSNSASIGVIYKVNRDAQANVFKDYYENHGFYMVFALKSPIFVLHLPWIYHQSIEHKVLRRLVKFIMSSEIFKRVSWKITMKIRDFVWFFGLNANFYPTTHLEFVTSR